MVLLLLLAILIVYSVISRRHCETVEAEFVSICTGTITIGVVFPSIVLIAAFFLARRFPIFIGLILASLGATIFTLPNLSITGLSFFLIILFLMLYDFYFFPIAFITTGSLFIISGLLATMDRRLDEHKGSLPDNPAASPNSIYPSALQPFWSPREKTIFIFAWVLLVLAASATSDLARHYQQTTIESASSAGHFNRGRTYANQGDFENAIIEYGKAIEIRPDFAEAHFYRGLAHLSTVPPEISEFFDDFDRVIRIDPNYAMAYYYRGVFRLHGVNLLLNDNRFNSSIREAQDSAISDFTHFLQLNPNNGIVYNFRGLSYYIKGDLDSAIRDFDQAIQLNRGLAIAYNNRGLAYAHKHNLDRAISDYDEAIKLDPYFGAAYYNRGQAYYDKGDLDLAIMDWEPALQENPRTWSYFSPGYVYYYRCEINNSLGLAYFHKDELDLAINEYDQAIHEQNCPVSVNFNRGLAYFYNGLYSQSLTIFKLIEPEDVDDFQYYYYRGLTNYYTDNQTIAITDFMWAIIFSHNYSLLDKDWSKNFNTGDLLNRAIGGFDKAIQLYPNEPLAYFFRGLTYSMNGKAENAIADLKMVLKLCDAGSSLCKDAQHALLVLGQ